MDLITYVKDYVLELRTMASPLHSPNFDII
jgi:hypothetical protein